jgi:hypothetical protein
MNPAELLAHLRRRSAGTRPDDHVAAPTHTALPGRCDETNPTSPKPLEGSPPRDELTPDQRAAIDAAATTRQPIDRTPTTSDMLTDLQTARAMLAQAHDVPEPIGQVWPSPRTWLYATVTDADIAREDRKLARLAHLTDQLGDPLAAAQAEFAPHLRKDTNA